MELPARLGLYRITGEVGKGGMGLVYRGEHIETGRRAAVKTVRVPYGSELAGLRCEIHALTQIHHPGIVRILDEGLHNGLPWYAMELLEGRTLEDYTNGLWTAARNVPARKSSSQAELSATVQAPLSSGKEASLRDTFEMPTMEAKVLAGQMVMAEPSDEGAAPVSMARLPAGAGQLSEMLTLIRRLCGPLAFIHGSGVVHRDLKPSNVFIRDDGSPVLMDFGLVSRSQGAGLGRETIEVAGTMMGTASYIAPEQINGQLVDARADLYSLGCMLYEMVTGRLPFAGASLPLLLRQHLSQAPIPPSQLADGVDKDLEALILRLLAKEPRDRLGHADDLAKILADLNGETGSILPVPVEHQPRAYLYRPEIVGREDVQKALGEKLKEAARGDGFLTLIGGESGVGKTCLAAAVARAATIDGMRVVTGECLPFASPDGAASDVKGAPLHPFRRLLQTIADYGREKGREATDRVVGRRGKVLAAYEPALRDLPGQDAFPEPPEVPAPAARRRILVALAETLSAFAAEQALLLILDDLQWADELSLSFLTLLDADYFRRCRLVVIGTYRSEEMSDGLRDVLDVGGVQSLSLSRLDEHTIGRIVGDMLAMPAPPTTFVRVLSRRSSGNPFFVAEYLRAAVAERLLVRERGTWQVAGAETATEEVYEALPLPRSLRDLVGRRLEGLSSGARFLVEVAAVLGREVEALVLSAVAGFDEDAALSAIKELLSHQVLEEVRAGRFRFVHDKLREIAYEHIAETRRHELHGKAAANLLRLHGGSQTFALRYSELAHHYTQAADLPHAVDYLEMAAMQALKTYANREAVSFLSDALLLDEKSKTPSPPLRRAAWERQLGSAYLGLGKLVESQEHLHKAVALLDFPMPNVTWRLVLGLLGQAIKQVVHRLRMPRHASLPEAERSHLLEAARAYDLLMPVSYFVTGELVRILYATLCNLNLAERAGPSPELALAYGNANLTTGLIPWFSLAENYGRRAQAILVGVSDPGVRSWVDVLIGSYSIGVGAWDDALAAGNRSLAIAEEVGFRRRVEEAQGVLGTTWFLHGDWEKARDMSQKTWDSGRRGDPQTQVWGAAGVAQACVQLGEMDRALTSASEGERYLSQKLGRPEKIIAWGVLAFTLLRSGDKKRAREVADKGAEAISQGTPTAFYCIHAYSCVAEVFMELWEHGDGESPADRARLGRKARRSVRQVEQSANVFPAHRPRALLLRGRIEALSGHLPKARSLYGRSFEAAKHLGLGHDEGLAELYTALTFEPGVPERTRRLRAAKKRFIEYKAAFDIARTDAALAGSDREAA